jgi:quinolinate synthase
MSTLLQRKRFAPLDEAALIEEILARKAALRQELLILTHHYQRQEIVSLGDVRGDSFALSRKAADSQKARFIVFCGVHFMAESAAILAQPHQTVQIPDPQAGCLMADMADLDLVSAAWEELSEIVGQGMISPIVYMNSEASLKAFCGRHGGAVCTSANARLALPWGLAQRQKVFFFPDQHLGRNTARLLGLGPEDLIVWDPEQPLGGNRPDDLRRARLILWDGHCHVHTRFTVEHVLARRQEFPGAKVVVHPECTEEVVALADACGSTDFIVEYVRQAGPGTTVVVGTEINLVARLALEYPDRQVLDLHYSLCPNMFRIDPAKLLLTLENLGEVNVVKVPEDIKAEARLALDRMLALKL